MIRLCVLVSVGIAFWLSSLDSHTLLTHDRTTKPAEGEGQWNYPKFCSIMIQGLQCIEFNMDTGLNTVGFVRCLLQHLSWGMHVEKAWPREKIFWVALKAECSFVRSCLPKEHHYKGDDFGQNIVIAYRVRPRTESSARPAMPGRIWCWSDHTQLCQKFGHLKPT